jgi:hypothetical protein
MVPSVIRRLVATFFFANVIARWNIIKSKKDKTRDNSIIVQIFYHSSNNNYGKSSYNTRSITKAY